MLQGAYRRVEADALATAEDVARRSVPHSIESVTDWAESETVRLGRTVAFHEHLSAGRAESARPHLVALLDGWGEDASSLAEVWERQTGEAPPRVSGSRQAREAALSVSEEQETTLGAPQPNPLRGDGEIPFILADEAYVRLALYDALGREVAVLTEGVREAGHHTVSLDGRALAPGMYVTRLQVGSGAELVQRLTVAR